MPITSDMFIDLALNVVGYVAAGALSLAVYSMFRRNPRTAPGPEKEEAKRLSQGERIQPKSTPVKDNRVVQYVNFGETDRREPESQSLTLRRNRAEVLRIARGMLRGGASDSEIKAALPVSDAELAVLNYERS